MKNVPSFNLNEALSLLDRKYPDGIYTTFRITGTGFVGDMDQRPFIKNLIRHAVVGEKEETIERIKKIWNYPCSCDYVRLKCVHDYSIMNTVINEIRNNHYEK